MKGAFVFTAVLVAAMCSLAFGHANYTGYSGAPGSNGLCASSCHGTTGGTIQITGFPAEYVPDQVYTLTVSHSGGTSIRQFNGSCRIGTGSANAGVISSGTNTITYNVSGETNGIHFTTTNLETATFDWTAPGAGTGEVRLYIAGLQGSSGGQNSNFVLTANEQVTSVPTLGQWGMMLMGLLLLLIGTIAVVRSKNFALNGVGR